MSLRTHLENLPSDEIELRAREDEWFASACGFVKPRLRDPIFTPIFTAIAASAGFSAGAAATIGTVASAIATTALTIGIQAMLAPKPPRPEKGRYPLQQSVPFRIWGVGRNRTAGVFMLFENSENEVTIYMVQALRGHRIKSVNRYWLHDDQVTLNGDGYVNSLGKRYAGGSVRIQNRLGLPVETPYADAVARMSSSGLWTNNHRGDGQASVFIRASATKNEQQMKRFPYGIPMLSVESDDAACWDPRDPDQNPDNPESWEWTQNAALHIIWWLCFSEFGFRLDYRKAIMPVLDLWIEDIDICDEDIPNAGGGTHKRYQSNLWDTTENDPKAGLNAFLAACDGHLVTRGDGARILTVGKFRESRCATLTDTDIIGHRIDYDVLPEDEVNRLIPKFTYPETDYTTTDTDFFEDTAAQLKAGRVLASDMDLVAVQNWRQARFLAYREWKRLQQKARGQVDVRLSGINAIYARWVRMDVPIRLPRLNGKLVENRRSIIAITKGGFTMDIVQHPDDIEDWDPTTDEGQQPTVPPKPNINDIVTPVINLVQARPNGQSVYIRVVIIDPEDDSLTPVVQYRLQDRGDGQPGAWVGISSTEVTPLSGYIDLSTTVVPSDQQLDIQVAFKNSGGSYSDWSVTASLRSTLDATPPGVPLNLAATNSSGDVSVSAMAQNDNTRALVFKRGTTSQTFAQAALVRRYSVISNQSIAFIDSPASGTWKYWVGAENGSGVPSATQASVTTVV